LNLKREQNYFNLIFSVDEPNTNNIFQIAGSCLKLNHITETRALMSIARIGIYSSVNKKVFVYSSAIPIIIPHEFVFYTKAVKYFNCSGITIFIYKKSGKLFKGK